MVISPPWSGARGLERLIWLKYYIALKRQITFNFWLNTAKNMHYIKEIYFRIKIVIHFEMMVTVNVKNIKKGQQFQYSYHYCHYYTADIHNYATASVRTVSK